MLNEIYVIPVTKKSSITFIMIFYYYCSIITAFYPLHLPLRNYSFVMFINFVSYSTAAAVAGAARVDRRPLQQSRLELRYYSVILSLLVYEKVILSKTSYKNAILKTK